MGKTITNGAYKIESGIPIPPAGGRPYSPITETLKSMRVGESILIADRSVATVITTVSRVSKMLGVKFTTRRLDKGVRVWRV